MKCPLDGNVSKIKEYKHSTALLQEQRGHVEPMSVLLVYHARGTTLVWNIFKWFFGLNILENKLYIILAENYLF